MDTTWDLMLLSWSRMRCPVRTLSALALVLLPAIAAAAPRTVKLRFPPFRLEAGERSERCRLVRVPLTAPFDVASIEVRNRGIGPRVEALHFLVYLYTGEHDAEWTSGPTVESLGCFDPGPVDREQRVLIAAGATKASAVVYPSGVALGLVPRAGAVGFLLDANWLNQGTRPARVSTTVILHRAKRGSVRRRAEPLLAQSPEQGLQVAPGAVGSTEASTAALGAPPDVWRPATDACVLLLSGHTRRRGRFFGIDLVDPAGDVVSPSARFRNPFEPGRAHYFGASDFTDPGFVGDVVQVRAGNGLAYACWADNGNDTTVRLGCEETVGIIPGRALGAAGGGASKPCRSADDCPAVDPAYPGRTFTGTCVAANLTAGPASDDEVCKLAGLTYDAAPDGGCNVAGLAPLP
jgi:hypothetical protein